MFKRLGPLNGILSPFTIWDFSTLFGYKSCYVNFVSVHQVGKEL